MYAYILKHRVKLLLAASLLLLILIIIGFGGLANAPGPNSQKPAKQSRQQAAAPLTTPAATDDPSSILFVVNKKRALPDGFVPSDISGNLRKEPMGQLSKLFEEARANGHLLKIISGYRSQAEQKKVYDAYVNRDGAAAADRYSARPGHSEHQTGLAVDIGNGTCDLQVCFGASAAGQWLAAHAHEYGFIIRYPEGKEPLTGYQYEPWHLRYVGLEAAGKIKQAGQTMEQYFGLPAAPAY